MATFPKKSQQPAAYEPPAVTVSAPVEAPIAAAPELIELVPAPAPFEAAAPVAELIPPAPAVAAVPAEVAKIFEAPAKSMTEMQEKVRAMIEKGLSETRANYAKAKSAADEANSALEASFASAKTGAAEFNAKVLEALRTGAEANFDFFKSILGVKSVSDYVTLHSEFTRKQIEAVTGQTKELSALARKVATETAEPIKAQVAKTFKVAV